MPQKIPKQPSNKDDIKFKEKELKRCRMIIRELENNPGFRELTKDLNGTKEMLDNSWYLTSDKKQLRDMQLRAYGTVLMVNILDKYEAMRDKYESDLDILKNPKKNINKDWDNE
jgi:hypothetical protein